MHTDSWLMNTFENHFSDETPANNSKIGKIPHAMLQKENKVLNITLTNDRQYLWKWII